MLRRWYGQSEMKAKRKSRSATGRRSRPSSTRRSRGDLKLGISGRRSRRHGNVASSDLNLRLKKVAPVYMPASEIEGHEDEDMGIRVEVTGSWKLPASYDDRRALARRIIEALVPDRAFHTELRKHRRQGAMAKNFEDWDIWDGGAWFIVRQGV